MIGIKNRFDYIEMKIALLILYNHRYDQNIPRIEKLYEGKFSHIFHIMPFYDGNLPNVIPVYESSYYFQSYIAQAYQQIKKMGFTHYFIVADDMIINPTINENNLFEVTGIPKDYCYIHNLRNITGHKTPPWAFKFYAYEYDPNQKGLEIINILPSFDEAKHTLENQGFRSRNLSFLEFVHDCFWALTHRRRKILFQTIRSGFLHRKPKYPLIGGWSDILLLNNNIMSSFCKYCGAFAASDLFAEIAIPTSLLLSSTQIVTTQDIALKNNIHLIYSLPHKAQDEFYQQNNYSLDKLLANYPKDRFFIHPIKLSQWK